MPYADERSEGKEGMRLSMNICFIMGKVLKDIEFEFMYEDKRISIAYTDLKLRDNTILTIKGYGKIADIMYRNIEKNDNILLKGNIVKEKNIEIEISEIRKL